MLHKQSDIAYTNYSDSCICRGVLWDHSLATLFHLRTFPGWRWLAMHNEGKPPLQWITLGRGCWKVLCRWDLSIKTVGSAVCNREILAGCRCAQESRNLPPSKRHVLRLSTSEEYKNRQHAANEAKRNARLAWKNAQNARWTSWALAWPVVNYFMNSIEMSARHDESALWDGGDHTPKFQYGFVWTWQFLMERSHWFTSGFLNVRKP